MIVITGATSGIGLACAHAFAKRNRNQSLFLIARRSDRLDRIAKDLEKSHGAIVFTAALDLRNRASVEALFEERHQELSQTKVLLNNAGLAKGLNPIQAGDLEDWDTMIDTNIKGLLYITRQCLPHLIQNRGHIVNMGSVAGHVVYPNGNIYCATKHAVKALNESLRLDLHGTGVRVTSIDPGMVETEFSLVRLGDPKKAKAVYEGMTPLTPEDVAEAVVWSVDRPSHVNIQEMILYPTDQASPFLINRKVKTL